MLVLNTKDFLGHLIYLTNTIPDITFVVHNLSQFVFAPTNHHQQAISRILRYLKGTPGANIYFSNTNIIQLHDFSDSNWATCPTTRKSVTEYSIYLGDSLISWKSNKQQTISRSSSEAEYSVLATTTCETTMVVLSSSESTSFSLNLPLCTTTTNLPYKLLQIKFFMIAPSTSKLTAT